MVFHYLHNELHTEVQGAIPVIAKNLCNAGNIPSVGFHGQQQNYFSFREVLSTGHTKLCISFLAQQRLLGCMDYWHSCLWNLLHLSCSSLQMEYWRNSKRAWTLDMN